MCDMGSLDGLRGIDSALKLGETQVTMFFSDIASFTTIVEKLPPERSLVLLSRYFNDMSQAGVIYIYLCIYTLVEICICYIERTYCSFKVSLFYAV